MLHSFTDIHTHLPGIPHSILSLPVSGVERVLSANAQLPPAERQSFSLQLHPWHLTGLADIQAFQTMAQRLSSCPQLVAIGECGLDSQCPTSPDLQREAFLAALHTARQLHLPVVVHCVRLWADMMACVHSVFPELRTQPEAWQQYPVIIHGFRKGSQLARQLLDAGFSLSLGTKYNPEVAKMLPAARCYRETDQE